MDRLESAQQIFQGGGEIILRHFGQEMPRTEKEKKDFVTTVGTEIEERATAAITVVSRVHHPLREW